MSASPVGMHAVLSNATVRRVPLNEYYGHAAVLREFCGVTDDRAIRGHLQHGWSPSPAADMRLGCEPYWTWGDRGARYFRQHRQTCHAMPIGAPWLYLRDESWPDRARDVLVFP